MIKKDNFVLYERLLGSVLANAERSNEVEKVRFLTFREVTRDGNGYINRVPRDLPLVYLYTTVYRYSVEYRK